MKERSIKDEKLGGCFAVSWEGKGRSQVWGGKDQQFEFREVEFQMSTGHPDKNVRQLVYKSGVQRRGRGRRLNLTSHQCTLN